MADNPVGWFEIYVQDMERARKFYEAMLQVKLEPRKGGDLEFMAFPRSSTSYGAGGALVTMQGVPSGGNSTLVYFSCQDCAEEARRAVTAGGKIMREKFPIGTHGFIVLAFDTEGNLFGLHSMR
jgi:predicted enzyme related to lactoylglutathione lyase